MKAIYRRGNRKLVKASVASGTVINIGDAVSYDATSDQVLPAASFTWTTDLATTQAAFADKFYGIAAESSANGETAQISIDVSDESVYEVDSASATYKPSTTIGPAKDTGNNMLSQSYASAVAASSIGRVVGPTKTSATRIEARFQSAFSNSNNSNANIG